MPQLHHRREGVLIASALRADLALFEPDALSYDASVTVQCNDVVLAEVVDVSVPADADRPGVDAGMELVTRDGSQLTFSYERARHAIVATLAGNRYAPLSVVGGLTNPITGRLNPPVSGGTIVDDLALFNIVGMANFTVGGHRRSRLRVLGVLLDEEGTPVNLVSRRATESSARNDKPLPPVVLVCGSGMNAGKTTCCMAIANGLRGSGVRVTFEKKTGTACARDPLRVQVGDARLLDAIGTRLSVAADALDVADFVDAVGAASDVSVDHAVLVERSLAFTPAFVARRRPDLHIVELADNLSHASNLALMGDARFRRMVSAIVYVPAPSFDAAHHSLSYLRGPLGWSDVPVAFSGPVANDDDWAALRSEIESRLAVPCVPSRDSGAAMAAWVQARIARHPGT